MKIGIVRHFKVDYKPKDRMNSTDFEEYIRDYDIAPVIKTDVNLGGNHWDKCYCSDIERACITAESIYEGTIIKNKLLREVNMYPIIKSSFKLPTNLWSVLSRIAWNFNNKSQLETKRETVSRAREFLNSLDLNKDENILIVSHGFFLIILINELRKLGFKGDIPKKMDNATLYLLERN